MVECLRCPGDKPVSENASVPNRQIPARRIEGNWKTNTGIEQRFTNNNTSASVFIVRLSETAGPAFVSLCRSIYTSRLGVVAHHQQQHHPSRNQKTPNHNLQKTPLQCCPTNSTPSSVNNNRSSFRSLATMDSPGSGSPLAQGNFYPHRLSNCFSSLDKLLLIHLHFFSFPLLSNRFKSFWPFAYYTLSLSFYCVQFRCHGAPY